MIWVTRLDKTKVMVNAELVETVESTPDTVLTLTTGRKMLVLESAEELASRVVSHRRLAYALRPRVGRREPRLEKGCS